LHRQNRPRLKITQLKLRHQINPGLIDIFGRPNNFYNFGEMVEGKLAERAPKELMERFEELKAAFRA